MLRSLMQTEISSINAHFLTSAWQWLAQGIEAIIPHRLHSMTFKPRYVLWEQQADTASPDVECSSTPLCIIEKSWLGQFRHAPLENKANASLPKALALRHDKVHIELMSIPKSETTDIQSIADLRTPTLSPHSFNLVKSAVSKALPRADGAKQVIEVAFVKSSTLQELQTNSQDHDDFDLIGYGSEPSGLFTFEFYRKPQAPFQKKLKSIIPTITLISSVILLLILLHFRLNEDLKYLTSYEEKLIIETKNIRRNIEKNHYEAAKPEPLMKNARHLFASLERLPKSLIVERIETSGDDIFIDGILPTQAIISPDVAIVRSRQQSQFRNFDRVSLLAGVSKEKRESP